MTDRPPSPSDSIETIILDVDHLIDPPEDLHRLLMSIINSMEPQTMRRETARHFRHTQNIAAGLTHCPRHIHYMSGGSYTIHNSPYMYFAPFSDRQLELIFDILWTHFKDRLPRYNIPAPYSYMNYVMVPNILILIAMCAVGVPEEQAESLFRRMATDIQII